MCAVNEQDTVAGPQHYFAKPFSVFIKKVDCYNAALDDKHLLQIVDCASDRLVIMRRLYKTGLMRQQPKLER